MSNERVLEGKVIVITGAGRGIGRAFALLAGAWRQSPRQQSRDGSHVLSWIRI